MWTTGGYLIIWIYFIYSEYSHVWQLNSLNVWYITFLNPKDLNSETHLAKEFWLRAYEPVICDRRLVVSVCVFARRMWFHLQECGVPDILKDPSIQIKTIISWIKPTFTAMLGYQAVMEISSTAPPVYTHKYKINRKRPNTFQTKGKKIEKGKNK